MKNPNGWPRQNLERYDCEFVNDNHGKKRENKNLNGLKTYRNSPSKSMKLVGAHGKIS